MNETFFARLPPATQAQVRELSVLTGFTDKQVISKAFTTCCELAGARPDPKKLRVFSYVQEVTPIEIIARMVTTYSELVPFGPAVRVRAANGRETDHVLYGQQSLADFMDTRDLPVVETNAIWETIPMYLG